MKFKHGYFYLLLFLLLSVGTFIYFKLLVFQELFLFEDIGGDLINQAWPLLMNLYNGFPGWTFNLGLGQNAFQSWYFDPLLISIHFVHKQQFIFSLPYIFLIKIILSGIFFYLYLRSMRISGYASVFGAISYAFCGQMVLLGSWLYWFSSAPVVIAFLLYASEMFVSHQKWFLLPLAIASISLVGSFFLWPYSIFLFAYAIFRNICEFKFNLRKSGLFFLRFTGLYFLGLALGAVLLLPDFWVIVQNPRTFGKASTFFDNIRTPLSIICTKEEISSGLIRIYSTDIMGTTENFKGWVNYMESPVLYCGLSVLILIPQVFKFIRLKLKVL